jgi:hypothetical protein
MALEAWKGKGAMTDEELSSFGSRRDFFKKMLALGFAVPVISSFALDGVASATPTKFPNQTCGNQTFGNQTFGNQRHIPPEEPPYRPKYLW